MSKKAKKLLILLAAAQFIFTLDSTVMNVSISTLVKDLNTTVGDIQSAIAFYSLVMAAFMVAGAKVGDIIGRKKAFIIGMCIYGAGSALTALAPNVQVLKFGWSFLEGMGAALAIPAMLSLIAGNFTKPDERLKAYGTVAAMAGIAAGLGPIIGGFLTTYATWRLAFAAEVLVVIWILVQQGLIRDVKLDGPKMKLDEVGVVLSVAGLGLLFARRAPTLRTEGPVWDEMIARAGPEAKGQNVVNVIIVDFRGLDTVGELGVLMVAVLGAVGLVRSDRLGRPRAAAAPAEVST